MSMFFAWNVRGLNSDRRHTFVKDWITTNRPLFGAFLETHIQSSNAGRIRNAIPLGWQFFGNYEQHNAGRIVVVWDPSVSVFIYRATEQAVTCGIYIMAQNVNLTITFVYGMNDVGDRQALWNDLAHIHGTPSMLHSPWAVVGDFNQILRLAHHSGFPHRVVDTTGMDDMNLALQNVELFEAVAKGVTFSWMNNNDSDPVSKKIDHALINQSWAARFPDAYAEFLEPGQSDHAACIYKIPSLRTHYRKPFKFYHHIIDHPEYPNVVAAAWNPGNVIGSNQFKLVRTMKLLKKDLRRINTRHFSGISTRVKDQTVKVEALQRVLLTQPDAATAVEEHSERDKLNVLLNAEQKFFRQRSRVRWADVGDRNTNFYHSNVTQRNARNHIHYLRDDHDTFLGTSEEIKSHAAAYFKNILGETELPVSPATLETLQELLAFRCSDIQQAYLKRQVLATEIKGTIDTMPRNKSPGPDGYCIEFLRASWDVVGNDVISAIEEFFRNGRLLKDLNTTTIVLIPKIDTATKLGEFRPISCCNLVYKIITKIIANRLKPILQKSISPNQAAFLKGRSLGENVLLASELIRNYNSSSCPRSCMLKVDIRKAFDTISWDFVVKSLEAQDFPPLFVTWIKECITSPRFSVAINGELAGFFPGKKGLRQGDSISPYLFILAMEALSRLLEEAVNRGEIRLHPMCHEPRITHLLFADDLLIFSDGSRHSLTGIKKVLSSFKEWTGLDMNAAKSEIFFGGYSDIECSVLSDITGVTLGSFPTRYLGLPLNPSRISMATLQPFLERVTSKLHSWTVKTLSFAGRVTMVSSVIYGMVNFWSSVFALPKSFYEKVDSLCCAFLWKNRVSSGAGARVSWESICKPKKEGGLGLRRLEEFEKVFALKRVWNLFSEAGSLWVAWLQANVFDRRCYWDIQDSQRLSPTVRGMIRIKEAVAEFLRCCIGDGRTASFWYDFWTDLGPLIQAFGQRGPRDLRIRLGAYVIEATVNGEWSLPAARSDVAETLQTVLSTMTPPILERGSDKYLWRNGEGHFVPKFSTKATWHSIREIAPTVQWYSMVWFKEEIPRCSFITWMAMLSRLPTRDRLASWGLAVPLQCVLCSTEFESHPHLFFGCPYVGAVWSRFCGHVIASPPLSFQEAAVILSNHQVVSSASLPAVIKLLLQCIIYCVWRERNSRIFRRESSSEAAVAARVDRLVRDRLISIPPPSDAAPSPLLVYFRIPPPDP